MIDVTTIDETFFDCRMTSDLRDPSRDDDDFDDFESSNNNGNSTTTIGGVSGISSSSTGAQQQQQNRRKLHGKSRKLRRDRKDSDAASKSMREPLVANSNGDGSSPTKSWRLTEDDFQVHKGFVKRMFEFTSSFTIRKKQISKV